MSLKPRILEIELAFSNACTASCFICSRAHGRGKWPFMSWDTFCKCIQQMGAIDFAVVQTGGDGDSFLNPIFIDALRVIRGVFPSVTVCLYSNFDLLTESIAEKLIQEQLITNLYTRIDSLDDKIFYASTGLSRKRIFENLSYFIAQNDNIEFVINYSCIPTYRTICNDVLGLSPQHWNPLLDSAIDEYVPLKSYFESLPAKRSVKVNRIARTLWAERSNPRIQPNPKAPCERTHLFSEVAYVWPDGAVGICGYDDGQDSLIIGNIHKETLSQLWTGETRKKRIQQVLNREIITYPCINPKACLFVADN
jgi:hypothetical protein